MKLSILVPLLVAGVSVFFLSGCEKRDTQAASAPASMAPVAVTSAATAPMPRLVDVGSKGCVPCRLMEPILEDLKTTRAHQFTTTFHDIRTEKEKIAEYAISIIPTQIFFDKDGKELFRHEGFFSKDEIMKKWKELGYAFDANG